eukprot:TRINITY_DN76507_c0_g1_i1.p1 TRINITY_DN76507_c0_g1~~TRINITY_DN76507_c0_g1_i1.p1  ORF type:complete len:504 (+),score=101.48 TRINITY_DN76507_c0_g1_i1:63-1574(+)
MSDESEDGSGFLDMQDKPAPSFEQEIKKRGFETFVVNMIESLGWAAFGGGADGDDGDYESHMLQKAEQYMKRHKNKVNLAKIVTGKFNFSGSYRAPALHWFLTCCWEENLRLLKHPSVTSEVINALDNKGNSALYYCHSEHYQAGWSFDRCTMEELISDTRFCAVDFPVIPSYGGGQEALDLPGGKVLSLLKRNLALPATPKTHKLRSTINSTRQGCSILHMICDEILIERDKCTVEIHAALTGKWVATLKVGGDETVMDLKMQKMMFGEKTTRGKFDFDTPTKFVNSKGAVLEEGDKIETINSKDPAQQSASAKRSPSTSSGDGNNNKAMQVFTAIVSCDSTNAVPASLVKIIRSHPEFKCINHVAEGDDRGGFGNETSHQIQRETCLEAVLRKVHSPARAKVVEELLKKHPSGDVSLDIHVTDGNALAALAEDNGYPANIVASIRQRGEASLPAPALMKRPAAASRKVTPRPVQKGVKVKGSITKKPAIAPRVFKKPAGKR